MLGELGGDALGEALDRFPILAGVERGDDVDALAAGDQRERLQARGVEQLAHVAGGVAHAVEVDARIGIEIEDEAVGLFQRLGARAPQVDFDAADLRHGDEAGGAVDHEVVGDLAVALLHRHRLERRGMPFLVCFWKKHCFAGPFRAAHEAERRACCNRAACGR